MYQFVIAALLLVSAAAGAQDRPAVPAPLQPWVTWALDGQEHRGCPFLLGATPGPEAAHVCAWPETLELDVSSEFARFSLGYRVLAETAVALPGDARLRPQAVRVDGREAVVLLQDGQPMLRLPAGRHRIEGQLRWTQRPTQLPVPENIGLVALRVDGAAIATPERDGDRLWLGRIANEVGADTLALRVFRRLEDGLPLQLTTRIRLEVSGRAREVGLGRVLPQGFAPVALESALPAAVLADGGLRVQLRPGTWEIDLRARATGLTDAVGPPSAEAPWPADEVWSWRAAPELRVVEIDGGTPVDPAQVGAPWDVALPTVVLTREQQLTMAERSRGKDAEQPHRLRLQRELWLEFDGSGVTARDRLGGQLARADRLNIAEPWTLQRASEVGGDLLVTRDAEGRIGVELRNPQLDLRSTGRHPGRGSMPASGWAVDVESLSAVLNLPPGWRLFAASGVDEAPQTWLGRWSLLDLFLLAVAGLLAFRLHGFGFAALVLGYLALGYHEAASPLWSLLAVIALSLVLQLLGSGRFATGVRWLRRALLLLAALLALPFIAEQLKLALHPQLERGAVSSNSGYFSDPHDRYASAAGGMAFLQQVDEFGGEDAALAEVTMAEPAAPAPMPAPPPPPPPEELRSRLGKTAASANVPQKQLNAYPDDAVVQAGPGTPDWRWQRLQLGWSGPVLAGQEMRLWLSPPWLTRLLRLLAVGLLVVLLLRLGGARLRLRRAASRASAAAAAGLLGCALLVPAGESSAEALPSPELLDELRDRLLQAPDCVPHCASLDEAGIELTADRLRLVLALHAEAGVAVPLPDPGKAAAPLGVELDGSPTSVLRHSGQRWVALPRGVHRLQIDWSLAAVDQLDLRFPMVPATLRVRAAGWESGGIDGDRLLGDTLQLLRLRGDGNGGIATATPASAQEFRPFVRVTRRLLLELDWTVQTEVLRVAPAQAGFSIVVPLLDDERVLDDQLDVRDGKVRLSFAAGEQVQRWRSRLPIADRLNLRFDDLASASERWEVQVGAFWHAEFSGFPESAYGIDDGLRRFDPRPSESLQIDLMRPAAIAGRSLAFDQVLLAMRQGSRARDSQLTAELRSTRGGQHLVRIPEDAELISASLGGRSLALRVENGELRLPLLPGAQTLELSWRRPLPAALRQTGEAVDLGAPAANLRTQLIHEDDRWLLAAGGDGVGPAVLYWGQLLLMLLVAVALSRVASAAPLRFHHWLLLGLGFSTVSWLAALAVVGWLLLLAWRQRHATAIVQSRVFPLVQLLLVLVSLIALLVLLAAIPYGLLGSPDMQVAGNGSSAGRLLWFSDRSDGALPSVWAISVPLWTYKLAILLWALWLANALIGWLRWAWQCFGSGGYWPPRKPRPPAAEATGRSTEASAVVEPPGA